VRHALGNYTTVVIDFETTGLSPNLGDRTIEVGAVLLENNQIIDRFQSLMNPGKKISGFIEDFTGITNKMLSTAPTISAVMEELKNFIADYPLVAHNAAFDSRFLDAEFSRIKHKRKNEFACSLLASRRLYQDAPNHKLQTLVKYHNLKTDGVHHRALADAEMTAHLWMRLIDDIKRSTGIESVPFGLIQKLSATPKSKIPQALLQLKIT
jgi:DNA polymerase-3 subunit epsilon